MNLIKPITPITAIQISIDRLSICFNDPNPENVKVTCGLLLSDLIAKQIPGMIVTKSAMYKVSALIPVPYLTPAKYTHAFYFQAGPHLPGLPSYRLDYNPSKMSDACTSEMMALIDSSIDADVLEFFREGRVTRVDVAIDLSGHTVDDLIIVTGRKQKHGVYSDRYGIPETAYFGTPRSNRLVAYTKPNEKTGELGTRIEFRLKPRCLGHEVAGLKNPIRKLGLYHASCLSDVVPGLPGRLIADSIRVRGVRHALEVFPPNDRKRIDKALLASALLLPTPDEIWSYWPGALVVAGLGAELGVIIGDSK